MSTHTVVESLAAYEAVRAEDPQGERVWWTTSPYLLVNLPTRGEAVRSPEEGLPQSEFDALALAARDLGDEFCAWYQEACTWKDFAQFHFVFALQLTRCFFVTAYKALLLSRILAIAGEQPVVCVGRPGDPELSSFSLVYGRVDTLFAALASSWHGATFSVLPHGLPVDASRAIEQQVRHRRMGGIEKILSVLNNTSGSWIFKIWKNLHQRGLFPKGGISFAPFCRKTYWVHKECELLHEATLGILRRGGRLALLPPLPRPDISRGDASVPPDGKAISDHLHELALRVLDRHGLAGRGALEVALQMLVRRSLLFLEVMRRNLSALTTGFDKTVIKLRPGDEILTSALTTPMEGLFYGYCRNRGIKVSAFDHGITFGLSDWSMSEARQAGMLAADRGFYHCLRAADAVRRYAPWQEMHAVGLPRATTRSLLRTLQRRLGRRLLGIGRNEQVLMHVPELERNNFIYGPYQENDLQFMRKTRQVTESLCRAYPNSRVVLKLYPTQRYVDAYDFSDLVRAFPNLMIVGDVDFRFVRASADLIFTASTQSTLGWVAGSGTPFVFLDFIWAPSRVSGLRLQFDEIQGLVALVLPDKDATCLVQPCDVAEKIMTREYL